jgi:hypothetical protein
VLLQLHALIRFLQQAVARCDKRSEKVVQLLNTWLSTSD